MEKVEKKLAFLNEFASTLSKPAPTPATNSDSSSQLINSKESVQNFFNFIESYAEKFDAFKENKLNQENEIQKIEEKIKATRENLDKLSKASFSKIMFVL